MVRGEKRKIDILSHIRVDRTEAAWVHREITQVNATSLIRVWFHEGVCRLDVACPLIAIHVGAELLTRES